MADSDAYQICLIEWERTFRTAAKKDSYRVLRAQLKKLGLPNKPALLLEGTILFVQTCVGYLMLDNQAVEEFLALQQYDSASVTDAPYLVAFDIHGKAYARVNLPVSLRPVDLADLYGAPWNEYQVVGYSDIWISRVDGTALSPEEMAGFEKVVEEDLRFDYAEDELNFWFDPDTHEGILKITVQDIYDDDVDEDQSIETVKDDSLSADGNQRQRRSKGLGKA